MEKTHNLSIIRKVNVMIQVDHDDDDPDEQVKGSLLNVIVGAADAPGEPSQTPVTHRHVSCRGLYPHPPMFSLFNVQFHKYSSVMAIITGDSD